MKPYLLAVLAFLTAFSLQAQVAGSGMDQGRAVKQHRVVYMATMEDTRKEIENTLFYNLQQCRYPKAGIRDYPQQEGNPGVGNQFLASVSGNNNKIGPAIVIKVDSGDAVDIFVQSFYHRNTVISRKGSGLIDDLFKILIPGISGTMYPVKGSLPISGYQPANPLLLSDLREFTEMYNPSTLNKPKGYLNWILFDRQFHFIQTYPQSGAIQVQEAEKINILGYKGIPISKEGFLFVYISNETPNWEVYFDNLAVTHYTTFNAAPAALATVSNTIITEDNFNIITEDNQNVIAEN